MSSFLLPLALAGTFAAVVLVVVAAQASLADRRRAVELLRSQVGEVSANYRDQELAVPFFDRVVVPFVTALGEAAKRITPIGMRKRIARKLVLGGSPAGLDADKVAAFKVFGSLGCGALGFGLATLAGLSGTLVPASTVFGLLFGYLLPGAGIGQRATNRQEGIQRALPDVMDLLTISVEAGLSFDAALARVRDNVTGPLSEEVGRLLQEMQLGVSRTDAFKHLGDRTDVEELRAFIRAMTQADIFGVSIGKVLRAQSRDLRIRRRQRAEEAAIKVPVKLLFPLIFCILPGMFVVLLGPGAIRIVEQFFGISF